MEKIFKEYEKRIEEIINELQATVVVFDFDGTLIEVSHDHNRLLPCRDQDLNNYALTHDIYASVRPLAIMQYVISKLDPQNVYILTVSKPNVVQQKQNAIKKLYSQVQCNHIIHVPDIKAKYVALEQLHIERNGKIHFIDDTLSTLIYAEEHFCFIKAIHISKFMI